MIALYVAPRAGIWCRSFSGWSDFTAALDSASEPAARIAEPVPELLPARESRRAPLLVRLALEVAAQTCRENNLSTTDVMSVFASAMGDTDITDYMCRTLAGASPMLSPTRFHNSVHNASSGYWSIGANNRLASTAVAAEADSFAAGMLEAATLAAGSRAPVLLVAHDVPAPHALQSVSTSRQAFAAGILLAAERVAPDWRAVRFGCRERRTETGASYAAWLETLRKENAAAASIALLAALARGGPFSIELPLGASTSIVLEPVG